MYAADGRSGWEKKSQNRMPSGAKTLSISDDRHETGAGADDDQFHRSQ